MSSSADSLTRHPRRHERNALRLSVFLEDVPFCPKDVLKENSRPSADD
jgi:hypothetical protein